jgi:hypothetical protein
MSYTLDQVSNELFNNESSKKRDEVCFTLDQVSNELLNNESSKKRDKVCYTLNQVTEALGEEYHHQQPPKKRTKFHETKITTNEPDNFDIFKFSSTKIKKLCEVFEVINNCGQYVKFRLTDKKIEINQKSESQCELFVIYINKDFFDDYLVKEQTIININISDLNQVLKSLKQSNAEKITFESMNCGKLKIIGEDSHGIIGETIISPSEVFDVDEVICDEAENFITVQSSDFCSILKSMASKFTLNLENEKNRMKFKTVCSESLTTLRYINIDEKVLQKIGNIDYKQSFKKKSFNVISSCNSLTGEFKLSFDNESCLTILCQVENITISAYFVEQNNVDDE